MSFRKKLRAMPVVGQAAYFLSTAGKKQLYNPVVLFKTIRYLPKYRRELAKFKQMAKESHTPLKFKNTFPVFVDYSKPVVSKHNWFQDIYVAAKIIDAHRQDPEFHHIDIGSRLEGFVTSLIAARVPLTFGDINLPKVLFQGTTARLLDLQKITAEHFAAAKSVSCLHVIEHLGLGRYGDAIDPIGHRRIFADFGRMLAPGTKLYISAPISKNPGIVFNGGRHLDPREMIADARGAGFEVEETAVVQDDWSFVIDPTDEQLGLSEYGCLILCLEKRNAAVLA